MNHIFEYQPIPAHRDFHMNDAREVAMFGGYGSGKSYALCAEAIAFMLEQPGVEILICRKTVPALRDTTEAIFVGLLPTSFFNACDVRRSGGHIQHIVFPNGSKVMFRGLDDWMKLKSLNLAGLFYDEVDELDEETYIGLNSRLRQTVPTAQARQLGAPRIERRIVRAASNPAGHNWVWKRFVGPDKYSQSAFYTSTSLDNPYLPLDYINSLLEMPEPWVRRYVLCSFDDFAGQIYADWTWDTHVIAPYETLDPSSFIWMGMDPGTADPTAGIWCYYDKERHWLVGVADYQEPGLAANVHASAWRGIEAKFGRIRVTRRIADPTVATRDRGTNMALDDQYRRLGYHFEHGPRLIPDRLPMLGQLITSGRFKVTSDCVRAYEQIRDYRWADLTPAQREQGTEAKPLKKNCHIVDAAQYVCSRYIAAPKVAFASVPPDADPERQRQMDFQAQLRANVRRQLTNRTATQAHDLGSMSV